jgi:hypothetical protein
LIANRTSHVNISEALLAKFAAALPPNAIRQSDTKKGLISSSHNCMCEGIAPPSSLKAR